MNVRDALEKNIEHFKSMSLRPDICVSKSQTSDDILQNVFLTTIKKFQDKDVEEDEIIKYVEKTFINEIKYQYKRLKSEIVIYTDEIPDIPE